MRVAVIGCGMFGAMVAIRLAEAGHDVEVFERAEKPLQGASYNNNNRLHQGFHYPRDEETARQCIQGFERFRETFGGCLQSVSPNAYFVASEGSLTSAADYLRFADRLGGYERLDIGAFRPRVRGVDVGISVSEMVYDCGELREEIRRRLGGVRCHFKTMVENIERLRRGGFCLHLRDDGFFVADTVINCTYADVNRLERMLGHSVKEYQYEYTAVQIIEWDQAPIGITIMDGSFMTVLPFGKTGKFLLYHVDHSVIARVVGTQLPVTWCAEETAPTVSSDFFEQMIGACRVFVPALETARPAGLLRSPRVVLAHQDGSDARPSIISHPEPGYVSILSGKIDHCMWVADEVVSRLGDVA